MMFNKLFKFYNYKIELVIVFRFDIGKECYGDFVRILDKVIL